MGKVLKGRRGNRWMSLWCGDGNAFTRGARG
jgi:hypothetical protein